MEHIQMEGWRQYIHDELDEPTRQQYEDHLYTCDQCLERYLQVLETSELPALSSSGEAAFTDSVMAEIENKPPQTAKSATRNTKRRQTLLHYGIAAAFTLVLMSTGVFSQLVNLTGAFEEKEAKQSNSVILNFLEKQPSFTYKWEEQSKEGDRK